MFYIFFSKYNSRTIKDIKLFSAFLSFTEAKTNYEISKWTGLKVGIFQISSMKSILECLRTKLQAPVILSAFVDIPVLNANNADTDQMHLLPHLICVCTICQGMKLKA